PRLCAATLTRHASCWRRRGCPAEPARKPARTEMRLLGHERCRRFLECPCRFRPAQKVHVHAPDLVVPEFDVTGPLSLVRFWQASAADLRNYRGCDHAGRALGEYTRLGG